jgi:hypothetical protein
MAIEKKRGKAVFMPDQLAIASAVVTIGDDGKTKIVGGLVRLEDMPTGPDQKRPLGYRPPSARRPARRCAQARHAGLVHPTAENYFSRIGKQQCSMPSAKPRVQPHAPALEKLKKGELAVQAERVVAGTGWLPALFFHAELEATVRGNARLTCRWSNPSPLRYGHRLSSVQLPAWSDFQINKLAGSQVSQNRFRVFSRALKHVSNSSDTLAVQRVFRFQPTKFDEDLADLLFLIWSQIRH